jgi:uncharacterized phage infection (PIP) family protein YhgE
MKASLFNKFLSYKAQPTAVPQNNTAEFDKLTTANTIAEVTSEVDAVDDVINDLNNMVAKIKSLSKNAAIEAARAREYGKDFSVVSGEMTTLSESTTKNINTISNSVQSITTQIPNAEVYREFEQRYDIDSEHRAGYAIGFQFFITSV